MTHGFKSWSAKQTKQELTKKQEAEEGAELDTCSFFSTRVKSIAPIQHGVSESHVRRDLLGGQPWQLTTAETMDPGTEPNGTKRVCVCVQTRSTKDRVGSNCKNPNGSYSLSNPRIQSGATHYYTTTLVSSSSSSSRTVPEWNLIMEIPGERNHSGPKRNQSGVGHRE